MLKKDKLSILFNRWFTMMAQDSSVGRGSRFDPFKASPMRVTVLVMNLNRQFAAFFAALRHGNCSRV